MPGLSDIIEVGASAVSSSAGSAGAVGQDLALSLIDGARAGTSSAFHAGDAIGDALLGGMMSPLGASGAALGDLAMTITGGVQDVIGRGVEGAGQLLSTGSELVGKLAGTIGGAVGLAVSLGFGGPVLGLLIGGVSLLIGSIVGAVGEGLGELVSIGGEAVGKLGEAVGKGFETMITVVEDVFNAAISRARSVGDISYSTGIGFAGANSTVQNFGALGVGSDKLASMLDGPSMNPLLFESRAGAFGLPGYDDPKFASSLASQYQQFQNMGPEGAIFGRQMMSQLGLDNPAMRRVASMAPGRIEAEQGFTRKLNSSMGLEPDAIRKFSEDFPLLINRVSQVAEVIKIKFASLLMDEAGGALLQLATYVSSNAEAIVGGLTSAATWIVTDLPVYVLTGLEMVLEGGQLFLTAISMFMGALAADLRNFANGSGVIYSILNPIASAIDFITVGFRGMMMFLAPLGAMIVDFNTILLSAGNTLLNALKSMLTSDSSPFVMGMRAAGYGDIVDSVRNFQLPTLGNGQLARQDPRDAYAWASGLQTTDLSGSLLNLQNSGLPQQAADWLDQKAPKFQNGADWLGAQKERVVELRDHWPQMLDELRRQNGALEKIADNTGQTATNTRGGLDIESFGRFFTNRTARGFANDLSRT